MEFKKKFKDNLGVIIAICTILGMVLGLLNAYILLNIAPLEREVKANGIAIEDFKKSYMPLDLSMEKWKNNDTMHIQIEKKLDMMDGKIDRLLTR